MSSQSTDPWIRVLRYERVLNEVEGALVIGRKLAALFGTPEELRQIDLALAASGKAAGEFLEPNKVSG